MKLQQFGFKDSNYERPNQEWVCGWAAEGHPCRRGPNDSGHCRATTECTPIRKGDRWQCARPVHFGGACEDGPLPDGKCCRVVPPCRPVRSIRARRGVVARWVAALTVGILGYLLVSPWRSRFISPGQLTVNHGQIIRDSDRDCAKCHSAANTGPAGWVKTAFVHPAGIGDSSNCMHCHASSPGLKSDPYHPHNQDPSFLADVTKRINGQQSATPIEASFVPSIPMNHDGQVACATCHHEHRGADFKLTAMSNAQCQSCHAIRFDSFAGGHPQFTTYPYNRAVAVKFNHEKHEPRLIKANKTFNCRDCHQPALDGRTMTVPASTTLCAACHDKWLDGSIGDVEKSVTFLQVPLLDRAALAGKAVIGQWPVDVNGDMSGTLSPLMKILLASDPNMARALKIAPKDLSKLDPKADPLQLQLQIRAEESIAWGIKALMVDLRARGQVAVQERLKKIIPNSDQQPPKFADLLAGVSATELAAAQKAWFPKAPEELAAHQLNPTQPLDPADSPKPVPVQSAPVQPAPANKANPAKPPAGGDLFDEAPASPPGKPAAPPKPPEKSGGDLFDDAPAAKPAAPAKAPAAVPAKPAAKAGDDLFDEGPAKPAAPPAAPPKAPAKGGDDLFDEAPAAKAPPQPATKPAAVAKAGGGLFDDDEAKPKTAASATPPASKAPEPVKVTELDPSKRVTNGGWYRDDSSMTLRYAAIGHANPFLRAWLEIPGKVQDENTTPGDEIFNAAVSQLRDHAHGAQCLQCHQAPAVTATINWAPTTAQLDERSFNKFFHAKHLNQPELQNCRSCHTLPSSIADHSAQMISAADMNGAVANTIGFLPMRKEVCATCHTPKLAGDSCLNCHNYHVDPQALPKPDAASPTAVADK